MSSLKFTAEEPEGSIVTVQTFKILCDFLQPKTSLTIESAARSILDILPDKDPESTDVWSFGETCIEIAEQIPYYHSSHIKLAALLAHLRVSTKVNSKYTLEVRP